MKACPYCAEDIQDKAIKCKHCGEWLEIEYEKAEEDLEESSGEQAPEAIRNLLFADDEEAGRNDTPQNEETEKPRPYRRDSMMSTKNRKKTDKKINFDLGFLDEEDKQEKGQVDQPRQTPSIKKPEDGSEGFGGWLMFFTVTYVFSNIVYFIEYLTSNDVIFIVFLIDFGIFAWLLYLLLKKKKSFKKWFFGIGVAVVIFGFFDVYSIATDEAALEAFRSLVYYGVWSAYLWKSHRVKNTLIN